MSRPTVALLVRAEPGVDAIRSLRAWLKIGLRTFGLRCVDIKPSNHMEANMIDLNEAEKQSGQTIPAGVYKVRSKLKPRGAGDEGLLRAAKNGPTSMLELELTVTEGVHAGHTLTDLITVSYDEAWGALDKQQDDRYRTAVRIGRSKLRRIIESARGIKPDDNSDDAKARRRIESYLEFDNISFVAQLETQPAQNGYRARNVVDFVITPDDPAWTPPTPPAIAAVAAARKREMDDDIPF
jgi:hypothetical protein